MDEKINKILYDVKYNIIGLDDAKNEILKIYKAHLTNIYNESYEKIYAYTRPIAKDNYELMKILVNHFENIKKWMD